MLSCKLFRADSLGFVCALGASCILLKGEKMPEHERTSQKNQENADQKYRVRQQDSQPLFERFHTWGQGTLSIGETPFQPRMDEHAALVSRIPFSKQRHDFILQLQQTYGNRYVQRLVESMKVQAKLAVSAPNDVYEQEADRVAKVVTRADNFQVKRQEEEEEEEEEPVQTKLASQVQRQEEEAEEEEEEPVQPKIQLAVEEEEELQGKPVGNQTAIVPENLETRIKAERGGGHPLSDTVREPMEHAFGADFSGVRVHTDSESDALNQQLSARAFATGQDVFFRENEYSPGSDSGRELIAHELTHVVQQGGVQQLPGKVTGGHQTSHSPKRVQRVISADDFRSKTKLSFGRKGRSGQFFQEVTEKLSSINLDADPVKKHKDMQELRKKLREWLKTEAGQKSSRRTPVVNLVGELTTEIKAEDIKYKTYGQIKLLKLKGLKEYIAEQPNWYIRSTISDEKRRGIEAIHAFALEEKTLAVCADYKVSDILAISGSMADKLAHLGFYVKAVNKKEPFSLTIGDNADKANAYGEALKKLSAKFPDYVLKSAMDEKSFKELFKNNYVDDVIKYYTTAGQTPIFQAEQGRDFLTYINMRAIDGKDPLSYDGTVLKGQIRNFHRFEAAALDQLVTNYGDTSKSKPLALILHSAIDNNGAFHRDPNLTAVITNSNIHALMIEGGETLAAYKSQIQPLAQTHGINNKIDQVMFAGHGGSKSMELAGKVEKDVTSGKLKQAGKSIDLEHDKAAADDMFDEVLKYMDKTTAAALTKQKNRRIIFNACLTNSNAVEIALSGDQLTARQEIQAYIQANASLATYLDKRIVAQGYDVASLGANASIGQVSLIEATSGKLDIKSTFDPEITASKIKYAKEGKEPEGALWAALESWATDPGATLSALATRSLKTETNWDDVIIQSIYALITTNKTHPALGVLIQLGAYMAGVLSHMKLEAHCRTENFVDYVDNYAAGLCEDIFKDLAGSDEWSSRKYIPLVFYQLWMQADTTDASLKSKFLTHLGANFDVNSARKYVDNNFLKDKGLIAGLVTGSASKDKDILALLGVLGDPVLDDCKIYLRSRRKAAVPEVPGLALVPEVPPVPEQDPPRPTVPKVPAVPGRLKVDAIPGTKRKDVAAVPDLPELPELPAVAAPTGKPKRGGAKAPGRAGRPEREAVPAVPEVPPYFDPTLKIKDLLAGAATEDGVLDKIK